MRQKERKTRRRKEERRCEEGGKEKEPKCRYRLRTVGKIHYKSGFNIKKRYRREDQKSLGGEKERKKRGRKEIVYGRGEMKMPQGNRER
jgi:hypothetical protein